MRRLLLLVPVALFLVPISAQAGGWATAGLDSTPAGVAPGKPWTPKITLLQHGRTPLEGVKPAIVVTGPNGFERRFAGRPTGEPGVYRAQVVFPRAGRYEYAVEDGFAASHSFPPVEIAAPAAAPAAPAPTPADDGFPWLALVLGCGGAAVLAGGGFLLTRRRRGAQPA